MGALQVGISPPTDTDVNPHNRFIPTIWKYGNVELHFFDDSLQLIYLDHFSAPTGSS
ncbi:MAG: hypothetical protein M3Q29_26435 [Chloroflexota bacterium]|nr:hypothetical protein [Chloroflexota bacterium]